MMKLIVNGDIQNFMRSTKRRFQRMYNYMKLILGGKK